MTSATAKSKETTINAKGNQNNDHERMPRHLLSCLSNVPCMIEETS